MTSRIDLEALAVRENCTDNAKTFAAAIVTASGLYSDVELAFWLNAPQPLLDGYTPIHLLARGESDRLLNALQALNDGVYL